MTTVKQQAEYEEHTSAIKGLLYEWQTAMDEGRCWDANYTVNTVMEMVKWMRAETAEMIDKDKR